VPCGPERPVRILRTAEFKIPYSHILIDEDGLGGGVVDQLTGVKGLWVAHRLSQHEQLSDARCSLHPTSR
jgi:hypothetical protein